MAENPVTLTEVEEFVRTLPRQYQQVFCWAADDARNLDTGTNEFQVATRIEDAFWSQAQYLDDVRGSSV